MRPVTAPCRRASSGGVGSAPSGRRVTDDLIPRFVGLLDQIRPSTTLAALELLAGELSDALSAAGWTISVTTDDQTAYPRRLWRRECARPEFGAARARTSRR